MCLASQAPLGELLSLRAYGRAIAQSDGPSFRVHWSEDGQVLQWDNGRLSMHQFRSVAQDVLQTAIAAVNRLMYDWDPVCNLATIKDQMANTSRGYSFVSEPANSLSEAYLDLSQRASLAGIDGLLSRDGWRQPRVSRYLDDSEAFLSLLFILVYLTGGQAAQGTELTSVEYQNGASTQRGIYVYGSAFVVVTRHHKSRHATNNEFQVGRFLPGAVGQLLYLYLVYIRPFTSMLRRVSGKVDDTEAPSILFASHARPALPWATEKLSKGLAGATSRLLGLAISARLYRQLSIAITEKHVRPISRPFNRQDDKSATAPIESAFAWQSGHRPLQRASTYGLDGAYPDRLQPGLLQTYQWVSGEWHRFLQLDSPGAHSTIPGSPLRTSRPAPADTDTPSAANSADAVRGTRQKRHRPLSNGTTTPTTTRDRPNKRLRRAEDASNDDWDPGRGGLEGGLERAHNWNGLWMQPGEAAAYSRATRLPWITKLPFTISHAELGAPASHSEPWRQILAYLRETDAERNRRFGQDIRFRPFLSLFRQWGAVGCQVCFASTGLVHTDHELNDCRQQGRASDSARNVLYWLEHLVIPRFGRGPGEQGLCNLCFRTQAICKDLIAANQIAYTVSTDDKEAALAEHFDPSLGTDGLCENKPTVRRTIAALWTWNGGVLGKAFTAFLALDKGIDIDAENHVRSWFEREVTTSLDLGRASGVGEQTPRLLFIFEALVAGFQHWNGSRQLPGRQLPRWISLDEDSPDRIRATLDWWLDKCAFCVGMGRSTAQHSHRLSSCPHGGTAQRRTRLGELFFLEGFRSKAGCRICGIPLTICQQQAGPEEDKRFEAEKVCQYGLTVYDAMVGLFQCGVSEYAIRIYESMDDGDSQDERDNEDVAAWLCRRVTLGGLECSMMTAELVYWTKDIVEAVSKR
jgi:hypothetical protein